MKYVIILLLLVGVLAALSMRGGSDSGDSGDNRTGNSKIRLEEKYGIAGEDP